jgi:hypothetical protein
VLVEFGELLIEPRERRSLRDALQVGVVDVDLSNSSAGRRLLALLKDLGWQR